MNAVPPSSMLENGVLIVFGKDQPEYLPLPASVDPHGLVMTEWEPSADELQALFTGGRVRLFMWKGLQHTCAKCGHHNPALLTPVKLETVAADPLSEYPSEKV